MVAISQMVSMVPEGLPVAMTIALAVGMQRMAGARRDHPPPVGGRDAGLDHRDLQRQDRHADAQRDDGRGAVAARTGARSSVDGVGYAPEGALVEGGRTPLPTPPTPALHALLQAAVLCNDAQLLPPEDERDGWRCWATRPKARCWCWRARPASTSARCGSDAPREAELPFDADTKLMATRHRMRRAHRAASGSRARPRPCCACARPTASAALQARARRGRGAWPRRRCACWPSPWWTTTRSTRPPASTRWPAARACSAWSARSTRRARRSRPRSPSAAPPASGR